MGHIWCIYGPPNDAENRDFTTIKIFLKDFIYQQCKPVSLYIYGIAKTNSINQPFKRNSYLKPYTFSINY